MSPLKVLTNMNLLPSVNKGRKPKFELHLKIYDLNNVPLVSGGSMVKWHISHSMHAEHRGRTHKCPISNHKVEFNYAKAVGHIRIGLDKFNNLTECPIEFEVVQEFPSSGRDDKISLGFVRLNLSEYVEESETIGRDAVPRTSRDGGSFDRGHFRKHRSTRSASSILGQSSGTNGNAESASTSSRPTSSSGTPAAESDEPDVEEGIIRRYLMQDSKINSTLKIGILMIQIDGDRNFIAPALKTAPVFGGIAGIMVGEQVEQDEAGQPPTIAKSRDMAEVQDMYRISLAASWVRQPGELPPDQCIEDIFAGGDGWSAELSPHTIAQDQHPQRKPSQASDRSTSSGGGRDSRSLPKDTATFDGAYSSDEGENSGGFGGDTLRPRDWRKLRKHNQPQPHHSGGHGHSLLHAFTPQHNLLRPRDSRHGSSASEKSNSTATVTGRNHATASGTSTPHLGGGDSGAFSTSPFPSFSSLHGRSSSRHRREDSGASSRDEHVASGQRSRKGSLTSLAPTMGSGSSGRREAGGIGGGYRKARELGFFGVTIASVILKYID